MIYIERFTVLLEIQLIASGFPPTWFKDIPGRVAMLKCTLRETFPSFKSRFAKL